MWNRLDDLQAKIEIFIINAVKVIFSVAVIVACVAYIKAELNRAYYPMPLYSANLVGLSAIALVLLWRGMIQSPRLSESTW